MATLTLPKTAKAAATRTDSRSGRYYTITHADGTTARYPSVTTILGAIAKPQLIPWAAAQERAACAEAAADLYADLAHQAQLPRAMYLLALEQRVGATKAHIKTLAKAAEIGSAAHAACEWWLKSSRGMLVGPEPTLADEALWAFMAFQDFAKAVGLEPLMVEQTVWSREYQYAGTLDVLARLNTRALLRVLAQQGPVTPELAAWLEDRDTATACIDMKTGKSIYSEAHLQNAAYSRAVQEMGHGRVDGGLIIRLPKVTTDPGFEVQVVPPARALMPTFLAARQLWEWTNAQEQAYRARTKVA